MHNQSLEAYEFGALQQQKYSLRHRYAHSRIHNPTHKHKSNVPSTHQPPPDYSNYGELPARLSSNCYGMGWNGDDRTFNCLSNGGKVLDLNRFTSVSFTHNHTACTTPSHQYRNSGLPIDKMYTQISESKLSLKSNKNGQASKSKTCLVPTLAVLRERLPTENYSQPTSIDELPQEDLNSEKSSGKYSLKSGTKKQAKTEVLISLKYADLTQPLGRAGTVNQKSASFRGGKQQNGKGKNSSGLTRSAVEGCKCDPNCHWASRWLITIGEIQPVRLQMPQDGKEWEATVKQVERDLPRTQPDHPSFQSPSMILILKEVLLTYAQHDWEVGYVQGMNFLAAAIIFHCRDANEAVRILTHIMRTCGFRRLFLGDLSFGREVATRLSQDLRKLAFDLYSHLTDQCLDIEMFVSSWYFSLCGSFVPLESMHLLLDKFIRRGFAGLNQVLLAMFLKMRDQLLAQSDSELMLSFSNQALTRAAAGADWQDLVTRSESLLLPAFQS